MPSPSIAFRSSLLRRVVWRVEQDVVAQQTPLGSIRCHCSALPRCPAERHDIRRRLPYFGIGQYITPCRHPEAAALLPVGDGLEHILRIIQVAVGQIDAAIAVCPVTM